ncbi:MAG: hypothetical protein R3F14_30495 [Polyangiaceae bacterium]
MKHLTTFLFSSLIFSTALSMAACGGNGTTATGGDGGAGGGGGAGGSDQSGVPCDVAKVLADKCLACHGTTPNGAPMSLVTYEDLTATSAADSSKTVIERAVIRMASTTSPMPPAGGSTQAEIDTLQAWIDAGTPKGDCSDIVDPFAAPIGCESGATWDPQSEEGPLMNPGEACITCHKNETNSFEMPPIFLVAGTVYPSGHESELCYGIDGTSPDFADVVVQVTDANGAQLNLKPNKTGNFYLEEAESFVLPYTAKVVSSKGERAMTASQTDGDCNACHTVEGGGNGSMAPGRIVIPY